MAEAELRCNSKHCRKPLDNVVWVTSCSHIFCEEDGEKHFSQNLICPACESTLSGESDIFRTTLNPSEQHRSMVLAGQRPETIIDICSRALNFWSYQICQEKLYQEWVAKKLRDQSATVEQQYKEMLLKSQSETQTLKVKLTNTIKDYSELQKKYDEIVEKYNEKSRHCQHLSTNYESLRKKAFTPNIYGAQTQRYRSESFGRSDSAGLTNLATCSPFFGQNSTNPPSKNQSEIKSFGFSRPVSSSGSTSSLRNPMRPSNSANSPNLMGQKSIGANGNQDFVLRPAITPPFLKSKKPNGNRANSENKFA